MFERNLTELHQDALKELGNIGNSHAATALSILLDCRVDCQPPNFFILSLSSISSFLEKPEEVCVGIFQRLNGTLSGGLLVLFARAEALYIANLMLGKRDGQRTILGENERSALAEVGNILSGSFMTALSQMTNLFSLPSVPNCIIDFAARILETVVSDFAGVSDQAIFIETVFALNGTNVKGKIFFFPSPLAIRTLLETLGL